MLDQNFSGRNFLRLTSRTDPRRHRLGRNRRQYLETLNRISEAALSDSFKFSRFAKSSIGNDPIFTVTSRVDEYVLRKLNDNLTRIYRVKQAARGQIVSQVATLLAEQVPFTAIKLDIKKFYESIHRKTLIEKICADTEPSFQTKRFLNLLFQPGRHFPGTGLPRGVGLSATLSEIYMKNFDEAMSTFDGVYFYARYVDDIIIFTCGNSTETIEFAKNNLPAGSHFNEVKEKIIHINEFGFSSNKNSSSLDYLGYTFNFKKKGDKKNDPQLTIEISKKKIDRIKNRIILSLISYTRNLDFELCRDRFAFITGNFVMESEKTKGKLYSGIYYNYHLISESSHQQLRDLDEFSRKVIFSRKNGFGRRLSCVLSDPGRRDLAKYSFETGFKAKIVKHFSPARLVKIKGCWKHV
ncbi:antiviral reverse transcriptase Drt3a [Paraburkholderia sp. BL21I4N1]|uniref:antiviral reverse transcriptase Drt3a n=1 Tax=Paraburkholderia sp. BL21I4N1 TaxID=1938801 RepID=UPI000CFB2AED|nr:antiviral reverse transcriptase Drt3a [Paraburkholderia sp. BL21I4N1]PQV54622.1 reverse transcriptase (RNA-dependent DNA polymerase) [Paraburkholderia sp. BL21I4N1]